MILIIKRRRAELAAWVATALIIATVAVLTRGAVITAGKAEEGVCVPILMYHETKTFKLGRDVISPDELEVDLKFLRDDGFETITVTQLIDYVYDGVPLPEKPVMLTFDDGYLNNYVYALPLLEKYDMCMVYSIIGRNADDFARVPDENLDYSHTTWAQLSEMLKTGRVEVQNHTYDLHCCDNERVGCLKASGESGESYAETLREDIMMLQSKLAEHTGCVPNAFTYPYGEYSAETDALIKEMGFLATLTCDFGINYITRDANSLYSLKRISRSHNNSAKNMLKKAGFPFQ